MSSAILQKITSTTTKKSFPYTINENAKTKLKTKHYLQLLQRKLNP